MGLKNHIVEPDDKQILHAVVGDIEQIRPCMAGQVAVIGTIYRDRATVGAILRIKLAKFLGPDQFALGRITTSECLTFA